MTFSHQTRGTLVQVFDSIDPNGVDTLVAKHTGKMLLENPSNLQLVHSLEEDATCSIITEILADTTSTLVRSYAPKKYVFDTAADELRRWLLHDGWIAEDGQLVRLAPAAEEVTGARDKLIEDLEKSRLDEPGDIRQALERSSKSFTSDPPDYNGAITNVRIALETLASRAVVTMDESVDTWGRALRVLREADVIDRQEEGVIARVYTFISDGAHRPRGIGDQEWAMLARTFGIGSIYFLLHKFLSWKPQAGAQQER